MALWYCFRSFSEHHSCCLQCALKSQIHCKAMVNQPGYLVCHLVFKSTSGFKNGFLFSMPHNGFCFLHMHHCFKWHMWIQSCIPFSHWTQCKLDSKNGDCRAAWLSWLSSCAYCLPSFSTGLVWFKAASLVRMVADSIPFVQVTPVWKLKRYCLPWSMFINEGREAETGIAMGRTKS